MVHSFKFGGQRVAYDSVSGAVIPLSELAFKMLDYIQLPMPKDCPSALRYDLAKFDSAAISDTYDEMYALYKEGKLFAENTAEHPDTVAGGMLAVGAKCVTHADPHVLDAAKAMADAGEDVTVTVASAENAADALTEDDLPALLKELEKLSKEQIKRARGEGGAPFTAFKRGAGPSHNDPVCINCWAKKLCTLGAPHGVMCELERKCAECVMMVEIAE